MRRFSLRHTRKAKEFYHVVSNRRLVLNLHFINMEIYGIFFPLGDNHISQCLSFLGGYCCICDIINIFFCEDKPIRPHEHHEAYSGCRIGFFYLGLSRPLWPVPASFVPPTTARRSCGVNSFIFPPCTIMVWISRVVADLCRSPLRHPQWIATL